MIIIYILLVAYVFAINFYAFLLVKSFRDKEREAEIKREAQPLYPNAVDKPLQGERCLGKLLITGALGGALTIYVCMFILKYRRSDLLLMVLMPLLAVLNVYVFVLLFRSGFLFFRVR